MSGKLVRKLNLTMAWNDTRIEQWLGDMARRGLHLVSVGAFGLYTFRQGEPAQVAYRIDYLPQRRRDRHYEQLLADAGWSLAAQSTSWQFWRAAVQEGKRVPELFTDGASRAAKYWRWTAVLLICAVGQLPGMMAIWNAWQSGMELPVRPLLAVLLVASNLFILYGIARLAGRIIALRGKPAL